MMSDPVGRVLWLCLVVTPLVLIGIELFHPAGFTETRDVPVHREPGRPGGTQRRPTRRGIQVLNTTWVDSWVSGIGSFVSHTGSWAVFFATLFLAIALFLAKKAPWPQLVLLVAFGWELQVSHTAFHGPIASPCWRWRRCGSDWRTAGLGPKPRFDPVAPARPG